MSIRLNTPDIPEGLRRVKCVDMHTGGEPLRIPISGIPEIEGKSVLSKRRYFMEHLDVFRRQLMYEPRGHADMYGAILTSSDDHEADFDAFFIHNEGYSTMCGHAIIALVKYAYEAHIVPAKKECTYVINVPAGKVYARGEVQGNKVIRSSFKNVPSFAYLLGEKVDVEGLGTIHFDIAYGGAFYAIVDARSCGLNLDPSASHLFVSYGRAIKKAIANNFSITHPEEEDLSFLYGVIFTGPSQDDAHHSRNVCVFADGEIDRSPTGTGVSARAALAVYKGELDLGKSLTIESIVGSTMTVRAVRRMNYHQYDAIIPEVSGQAYFSGHSEFYIDPYDPLKDGFLLR